ncbi:MAG: hypothetical protein U0176_16995 [Bacteroidia bacterium]
MKRCHFLVILLAVSLLAGAHSSVAQKAAKPEHRFALRLNLLGILSLSERLELEYAISRRIGVFVGSGFGKEPVTDPFGFYLYRARFSNPLCSTFGGSVYAGVRVGIPIWKFVGLSVKGLVIGSHFKMQSDVPGWDQCNPGLSWPPLVDPYYRNSVSFPACAAYAQTLGKHFFIEPLVGIGPLFTSLGGKRKPDYWTYTTGAQLNMGVRF